MDRSKTLTNSKDSTLKAFVQLNLANAYFLEGELGKARETYQKLTGIGYTGYEDIVTTNIDYIQSLENDPDFIGIESGKVLQIGTTGSFSDKDGNVYSWKIMKDKKKWMTKNLNLEVKDSWCYKGKPANCDKYGRLYTWEAAKQACKQLGDGWKLPTDEDWKEMAGFYGGYDYSKEAYQALLNGGSSGFNALLGGTRDTGGSFLNLGAYGGYWSATETGGGSAYFYDFYGDVRVCSEQPRVRALGCLCVASRTRLFDYLAISNFHVLIPKITV